RLGTVVDRQDLKRQREPPHLGAERGDLLRQFGGAITSRDQHRIMDHGRILAPGADGREASRSIAKRRKGAKSKRAVSRGVALASAVCQWRRGHWQTALASATPCSSIPSRLTAEPLQTVKKG